MQVQVSGTGKYRYKESFMR